MEDKQGTGDIFILNLLQRGYPEENKIVLFQENYLPGGKKFGV